MRGILDKKEDLEKYKEVVCEILKRESVFPEKVFSEKFSCFLFSDFSLILTENFYTSINYFLKEQKDENLIFFSLDPDPENYYYHYFKKYNVIEYSSGELNNLFYLFKQPEKESADAIGDIVNKAILFSNSQNWAFYGERDFDIGVFAFSNTIVKAQFLENTALKLVPAQLAMEDILEEFCEEKEIIKQNYPSCY